VTDFIILTSQQNTNAYHTTTKKITQQDGYATETYILPLAPGRLPRDNQPMAIRDPASKRAYSLKITKRGIQIALGLLWLLDGVLQLQPQMFTANFAHSVIARAALGQPGFVSGPMHFFIHIFLFQPALFNSLIAVTQIGLGILILWQKTAKFGLMASVGWALFVWYIGEGLGGLASGQTLLLMGAPGAALIYALLALGVMPHASARHDKNAKPHPAYWLMIVWAVLWIVGSVYQLLPGQNTVAGVSSMIAGNANGAPSWMASLDRNVANIISGFGKATSPVQSGMNMTASQMARMPSHHVSGYWFILIVVIIQLLTGLAVFIPGYSRNIAIAAGIVLSAGFWIIGQSMGSYFSGLATDPGSGPLFILLGVAVLGCTQLDHKIMSFYPRIESLLVGPPPSETAPTARN
jgi:hypothetical protein